LLSVAVALMVIVAGAVNAAPLAGLVIEDVGGWFCAAFTVTLTADDVVVAPSLSRATAVSEYVPADTLLHVALYGAAVSLPTSCVPA
jgi:hypothetical protein